MSAFLDAKYRVLAVLILNFLMISCTQKSGIQGHLSASTASNGSSSVSSPGSPSPQPSATPTATTSPTPTPAPSASPSPAPTATASAAPSGACTQGTAPTIDYSDVSQIFNFYTSINKLSLGNYQITDDDWGMDYSLSMWMKNYNCWSVSTGVTSDRGYPWSYAHVVRGWSNDGITDTLSSSASVNAGAPDWTTKSGMGVAVSTLSQANYTAKVHWAMNVPSTTTVGTNTSKSNISDAPSRWDALIDNYFFSTPNPSTSIWPPVIDLQIMQMTMDQSYSNLGFVGYGLSTNNPFFITISGVTYAGVLDTDQGQFHSKGGHCIQLNVVPKGTTSIPNKSCKSGESSCPENMMYGSVLWGQPSVTHDLAGIVAWLSGTRPDDLGKVFPIDDTGKNIKFGASGSNTDLLPNGSAEAGTLVTAPVISPTLYLGSVNAGYEVDFGTAPNNNTWTTTNFWVQMQGEQAPSSTP